MQKLFSMENVIRPILLLALMLLSTLPTSPRALGYDGPINSGGGDPDAIEFIKIGKRIVRWLPKSKFSKLIPPGEFSSYISELDRTISGPDPQLIFTQQVPCPLNDEVEKAGCVKPDGKIYIDRTAWFQYKESPEKKCTLVTQEILFKMNVRNNRYNLADMFIESEGGKIICDVRKPTYPLPGERIGSSPRFIDVRYACYSEKDSTQYDIVAELALNQDPDYLRVYRDYANPELYLRSVGDRPITTTPNIAIDFFKKFKVPLFTFLGVTTFGAGELALGAYLVDEGFASFFFLPALIYGGYQGYHLGQDDSPPLPLVSAESKEFLDKYACALLDPKVLEELKFKKVPEDQALSTQQNNP